MRVLPIEVVFRFEDLLRFPSGSYVIIPRGLVYFVNYGLSLWEYLNRGVELPFYSLELGDIVQVGDNVLDFAPRVKRRLRDANPRAFLLFPDFVNPVFLRELSSYHLSTEYPLYIVIFDTPFLYRYLKMLGRKSVFLIPVSLGDEKLENAVVEAMSSTIASTLYPLDLLNLIRLHKPSGAEVSIYALSALPNLSLTINLKQVSNYAWHMGTIIRNFREAFVSSIFSPRLTQKVMKYIIPEEARTREERLAYRLLRIGIYVTPEEILK